MNDFANLFLKLGSVFIVLGVIFVFIWSKKPEIIPDYVAEVFLTLGFIPIFFNFLDAICDFVVWIWKLFK